MFKTIVFFIVALAALLTSVTSAHAETKVNFISWPNDVVYVYDTTSGVKSTNGAVRWPVRAAAEYWDNDNPVNFIYTTKGCPADAQCVTVTQKELPDPAAGTTVTTFAGADIKSSNIMLDTTFGRKSNYDRRRNAICHELGHALGLKHRNETSSCMTSYITEERYADGTDVKNLDTMYGYR